VDLVQEEIANARRSGISHFTDAALSKLAHMARRRTRYTFVACFCANPASEFHWKNYGEYCLTFDTDLRREPLLRTYTSRVSLQYHRIIYDERHQRDAVRTAIANVVASLDRNTTGLGPWTPWNVGFLARIASELLIDLIVSFKRPEYAADAEWRLVVRPNLALCSSAPASEDEAFELLVRAEKLKRYVELCGQRNTAFFPMMLRPPVPFSAVVESPYIADPQSSSALLRVLVENGCNNIEISRGG